MLCLQNAHLVPRGFPGMKLKTSFTFRVEAQISFLWQSEIKHFYKKNHSIYGCSPNASLYIYLPSCFAPWALFCTTRKVYKYCHITLKPGKHKKTLFEKKNYKMYLKFFILHRIDLYILRTTSVIWHKLMRSYLKITEFTPYEFKVQSECKIECAAYFSLFFSGSRG